MAPTNAPAAVVPGVANPASKRPSAARPYIRPVLPLPYTKRQPKTASTNNIHPPSPLRTNSETAPPTPKQEHQDSPQPPESALVEPLTNGHKPLDDSPASPLEPDETKKVDARVTTAEADDRPASGEESRPVTAGIQTQGTPTPTQSQTTGETTPPDTLPSAASSVSCPPRALSPPPFNTNNTGPPPHPANFRGPVPERINLPSQPLHLQGVHPHQFQQHQKHMSNGSMTFGFHGSNASSPVPHPGGVFLPPMPMSHEQLPTTGVDGFGNSMLAAAPINGHVPVAINHCPLTPHSFHGSQSSRDAVEFANRKMANGNNSIDFGRGPPTGVPPPPQSANRQVPFHTNGFQVGQALDFAEYISSLFARPDFADCELVLDIPDRLTLINSAQAAGQPSGPLRLPAHQLVLSHHPLLRRIVQDQLRSADGPREVRIVSNDPFLRADSMWRAIKYLYGFRHVPLPYEIEKQPNVEKFHFVLGYAAAGAYLEVPYISITAMREAIDLLSWDTAEKGMEFALAGLEYDNDPRPVQIPHAFPQFRYKHGAYVGELVDKIMVFLATNFPRDFALDTSVEDPRYSRLPARHPRRETPNQTPKNGHVTARATDINIKFGDMETNETNGHGQPYPQASAAHLAALSRLMLNLPYEILKLVLESNGIGEVAGWRTVQDRRRAMVAVVAEREARREYLIRELVSGRLDLRVPVEELRSEKPRLLPGNWSNVCWKEECIHRAEGPVMNRVWTPLSDAY